MGETRQNCREDAGNSGVRGPNNLAALSETLRNGAASGSMPAKGEERVSLFWRVFGGTLLSIAALVVITVYQQFSSSLHELRSDVIHVNEARADLVTKEDFNNRLTSVWNSMKDVQTATATVATLRERTALLEQQLKEAENERKELTREVQQLRDRVAATEGQLKTRHATGD
jgi:septal ring factor EnvC (AmiA/AmiB activator)